MRKTMLQIFTRDALVAIIVGGTIYLVITNMELLFMIWCAGLTVRVIYKYVQGVKRRAREVLSIKRDRMLRRRAEQEAGICTR